MTYQHGKAPADAPVTWRRGEYSPYYAVMRGIEIVYELEADLHTEDEVNDMCNAFHLAKLAGEARGIIGRDDGTFRIHGELADWLRRYDAANGN